MDRKILFLMLLFLGLSLSERGFAQQFSLKELPISVAYFGENGIHPGLKFSTSYAFWSKTKYRQYHSLKKQGKWGEKGKRRELLADFNLGFYSHPNNHTGIFGNVGASYLRTKLRKNRQFGISLEVGFLGRINKFNTYQLSPEGNIEEIGFAGNTALMLSMAPMFGKEFNLSGKPVRVFVKPWAQLLQYTHTWQPNANLEIGMVFNIHRQEEKRK